MSDKSNGLVKLSDGCYPWSQEHPSLIMKLPKGWPLLGEKYESSFKYNIGVNFTQVSYP